MWNLLGSDEEDEEDQDEEYNYSEDEDEGENEDEEENEEENEEGKMKREKNCEKSSPLTLLPVNRLNGNGIQRQCSCQNNDETSGH